MKLSVGQPDQGGKHKHPRRTTSALAHGMQTTTSSIKPQKYDKYTKERGYKEESSKLQKCVVGERCWRWCRRQRPSF